MTNYVVHRCRLFEYTPCAIQCIVSSKTSKDIAIGRSDGSIEIWNTECCWFQKLVIPGALNRSIESLIWLGNRLISGGLNGDIIEYDLTNATIKLSVDSFGGAVWCICSSPDEESVAAGCEDGSIKIFTTKDKFITFTKAFDRQEGRILSISWHNSGDVIVTGSSDVIRIWSVKTGHAIQRITLERTMKNVETIVWTVAILSDYTVVSGDSSGRVQFWNGKNATLLKSHQVHRADVQCFCVSDDETSVFASGVDPKVFRFSLLSKCDPTSWIVGQSEIKHTHDVRALSLNGNRLVSGGVDTSIMTKYINGKTSKSYSFPTKSTVSLAKSSNLLLLQYSNYLDIWKLATSSQPPDVIPGKCLPIEEEPVKLLQIKPPSSDPNHISCSCISSCGTWLSYSTASATRLYRLHFADGNINLQISRVRCVGLSPAYEIAFTPDSSHVIFSTNKHQLLIFKLDDENNEARLLQMLPLKNVTTVTHLLSVSSQSRFIACASLNGDVDVFDITNMTHHCTVPCYKQIPTAMSFHPITNDLMIVYNNLQVLEYNVSKLAYTDWTKQCLSSDNMPLLEMLRDSYRPHSNAAVVTSISYDVTKGKDTVLFMSREGIFVVDRSQFSAVGDEVAASARFCHKFAPLLFHDFLASDTLLVVERPLRDIYDKLPPTLYQKKFGT